MHKILWLLIPLYLNLNRVEGLNQIISSEHPLWRNLNIDKLLSNYLILRHNSQHSGTWCDQTISEFQSGLASYDEWAYKIFDANSKIQTGLLSGNIHNLGQYDQCIQVNKFIEPHRKIRTKYCRIEIEIPSRLISSTKNYHDVQHTMEYHYGDTVVLTWGLCLPLQCNISDIFLHVEPHLMEDNSRLEIIAEERDCVSSLYESQPYTFNDKCMALILLLLFFLIYFGTTSDILMLESGCHPFLNEIHEILKNISIRKSWNSLLRTERREDIQKIGCLDGIRCISLFWIIAYHRFDRLPMNPVVNMNDYAQWVLSFESLLIMVGKMAVESFFTMSGLLISYNFLKSKSRLNCVKFYMRRYFRLTPVIIVWIYLIRLVLQFRGSGPLWSDAIDSVLIPCEMNIWSTLLYFQNYWNVDHMCLHQTWYLNVDTQLYFTLAPILLWLLSRKMQKTFIGIILSLLVLSWRILLAIVQDHRFNAGVFLGNADEIQERDNLIYYPTHARISSWLIGFISGFIIFKSEEQNFVLNKGLQYTFYGIVAFVQGTTIYGYFQLTQLTYGYNLHLDSLFLVFHRPIWAVTNVVIIYHCARHSRGYLNEFLTMKIWQVVSKLSYTAYIVHFQWQIIADGTLRTPEYFGFVEMLYKSIGDIVCSLLIGLPLYLFVEAPCTRLINIFCKTEKNKRT